MPRAAYTAVNSTMVAAYWQIGRRNHNSKFSLPRYDHFTAKRPCPPSPLLSRFLPFPRCPSW